MSYNVIVPSDALCHVYASESFNCNIQGTAIGYRQYCVLRSTFIGVMALQQ